MRDCGGGRNNQRTHLELHLKDKVVLITGGASGIGEAVARAFVGEAAKVAIVDKDAVRGNSLAAELEQVTFIETDLCSEAACEQAVKTTIGQLGRIDIVVNNAGTNDSVGIEQGVQAFEASLKRNLFHYYSIVHHAAEQLKANRGNIINIGSKVSETGQGGTSGYAAAKGAINALTREWAAELAASQVRVNGVIPAEVWTPMYERWLDQQPDGQAERQRIEKSIPLGNRFTTAEEMANSVVFLASSAASHTTGQILYVDGGYVHLDRRLG